MATFEPTRSSGSFRAWLLTITRRKVLDYLRKQSRHPQAAEGSTAVAVLQQVLDASTVPDLEPTGDK